MSNINLKDIIESSCNIRSSYTQELVQDLADSIQEEGLNSRIALRKTPSGKFEVLAGSRRVKALRLVRGDKGEVSDHEYVLRDVDDEQAVRISISENAQRTNLSTMDMTLAISKLREVQPSIKSKEIAKVLWTTEAQVKRMIHLTDDDKENLIPANAREEMDQPLETLPLFTDKHWEEVRKSIKDSELSHDQVGDVCQYIIDNEIPASKVADAVSRVVKPAQEESDGSEKSPEPEDDNPFKEKFKGALILKDDPEGGLPKILIRNKKEDQVLPLQMLLDYLKFPDKFSVFVNLSIEVKPKEQEFNPS